MPRPQGSKKAELPPRARRILLDESKIAIIIGTTSACAENTGCGFETLGYAGNYLRVRGEYIIAFAKIIGVEELPPRARRIRLALSRLVLWCGTTSACAENTQVMPVAQIEKWNYLRVRGEYPTKPHGHHGGRELPPRARRIPGGVEHPTPHVGTTSACAENTQAKIVFIENARNYLRVRGEYLIESKDTRAKQELPPRARRIPAQLLRAYRIRGTTSACAENTSAPP